MKNWLAIAFLLTSIGCGGGVPDPTQQSVQDAALNICKDVYLESVRVEGSDLSDAQHLASITLVPKNVWDAMTFTLENQRNVTKKTEQRQTCFIADFVMRNPVEHIQVSSVVKITVSETEDGKKYVQAEDMGYEPVVDTIP